MGPPHATKTLALKPLIRYSRMDGILCKTHGIMSDAFKRHRKSTNVEDRRVARDITKPVSSMATDPPPNPATLDPVKVKYDRVRASMSTMEHFPTSGFKAAFNRKRK